MSEKTLTGKNKKARLVILAVTGLAFLIIVSLLRFGDREKKAANFPAVLQDGKIVITASDRVQGPENAKITFIEYSDFQCPYCVKFHATMEKVMQEYDGKVRWVYRHSPLPIHKAAPKAAEAAECAGEQGNFWEYAAALTKNSQPDGTGLAVPDLKKYSKELTLDEQKFNNCLDGGKFKEKIKLDLDSGKKLGVQGTPATFMIDGTGNQQLISGALPYEQVKAKIDSVLK